MWTRAKTGQVRELFLANGVMAVTSPADRGTTVRLYLPRAAAAGAVTTPPPAPVAHPRGGEIILVVEDRADVRRYVVAQLRDLGYRVIEAEDGPQALKALDADAAVDLLLTDMAMPGGISGRQLAEAAKRRRPHLRVLFTSGHAEDAVAEDGELDPRAQFLAKPYTRQDLARKVREALGMPD
jgi:CheY-like chemotaxis protein